MLGSIGKEVAKELGLEHPDTYTGHCFRRSSATEAANKGATSVDLKRHFGWVGEQTALKVNTFLHHHFNSIQYHSHMTCSKFSDPIVTVKLGGTEGRTSRLDLSLRA